VPKAGVPEHAVPGSDEAASASGTLAAIQSPPVGSDNADLPAGECPGRSVGQHRKMSIAVHETPAREQTQIVASAEWRAGIEESELTIPAAAASG
jgi:hypothetical protein